MYTHVSTSDLPNQSLGVHGGDIHFQQALQVSLTNLKRNFPGGPVVCQSACQCRRQWFNPWSRKIPRAVEQLSLRATIEPVL